MFWNYAPDREKFNKAITYREIYMKDIYILRDREIDMKTQIEITVSKRGKGF